MIRENLQPIENRLLDCCRGKPKGDPFISHLFGVIF